MATKRVKRTLTPNRFDGEVLGLVLFAVGIFLAVTVALPERGAGFMAQAHHLLVGGLSWAAWLLPLIPVAYGVLVFVGRELRKLTRVVAGVLVVAASLLALQELILPGTAGSAAQAAMTPLFRAVSYAAALLPLITLTLGTELILRLSPTLLLRGFFRGLSHLLAAGAGRARGAVEARQEGRELAQARGAARSSLGAHIRDLDALRRIYPQARELADWQQEARDKARELNTLDEAGLKAAEKELKGWRETSGGFVAGLTRDLLAQVTAEDTAPALALEARAQQIRAGTHPLSGELPSTLASGALERLRRALVMDAQRLASRAGGLERERRAAEKALAREAQGKAGADTLLRERPRHQTRAAAWSDLNTRAGEWQARAELYPGWPQLAAAYDRAPAELAATLEEALGRDPQTTLAAREDWEARLERVPEPGGTQQEQQAAAPETFSFDFGSFDLGGFNSGSTDCGSDGDGHAAPRLEEQDTSDAPAPHGQALLDRLDGPQDELPISAPPVFAPPVSMLAGPMAPFPTLAPPPVVQTRLSAAPAVTAAVYSGAAVQDAPAAQSVPAGQAATVQTLPQMVQTLPQTIPTPPWEELPAEPESASSTLTFSAATPAPVMAPSVMAPDPTPFPSTTVLSAAVPPTAVPLPPAPSQEGGAAQLSASRKPVTLPASAQGPAGSAPAPLGAIDIAIPGLDLLDPVPALPLGTAQLDAQARQRAGLIDQTLAQFGLSGRVVDFARGPTVTRYEIEPAPGEKISRIAGLSNDLARALAVGGVRVEAPVPGKSVIGLEVPNAEREPVTFHTAVSAPSFQATRAKLPIILGKSIDGEHMVGDLAKMPHLLIAGSTGSGKSVCVNTLITSLLYRYLPTELRFLMVDPKMVELTPYDGIPHLVRGVVTNPIDAAGVLLGAVAHMERRYKMMSQTGAKNLEQYNAKMRLVGDPELPHLVIIIDELADLMITSPKEVESAIMRLAQMARATGMHLVLATQRPSVDILTSLIKVNVPARIAFAVSSSHDSRTILDSVGAERLTGMGDMLFYQPGLVKPMRLQGPYISEHESVRISDYLRRQVFEDVFVELYGSDFDGGIEAGGGPVSDRTNMDFSDPHLRQAAVICIEEGQGSVSRLQRRLSVGHARAGKLMDMLEAMGIVSKHQGSKPRDVLIGEADLPEYFGR